MSRGDDKKLPEAGNLLRLESVLQQAEEERWTPFTEEGEKSCDTPLLVIAFCACSVHASRIGHVHISAPVPAPPLSCTVHHSSIQAVLDRAFVQPALLQPDHKGRHLCTWLTCTLVMQLWWSLVKNNTDSNHYTSTNYYGTPATLPCSSY